MKQGELRSRDMPIRDVFALVGRQVEDLPAIRPGDAGCLLPLWLDPEAVDFLQLLEGRAGAATVEGAYAWRRSPSEPELLVLDRPILGVEVAAPVPSDLASGVEFIAERADRLLPAIQADLERASGDNTTWSDDGTMLREVLAERLRIDIAVPGPETPPHVRFRPAEQMPGHPPRLLDADRVRAHLHEPDLQDHRAVIPPRGRFRGP